MWLETNNLFNNLIQRNQSAAFSSGKVRPNHETNINIIARRTGKDVNSHTVLDGIITTIMDILIKLIRVSLGTVRHPRRFKIVVIDIQITLKQMLRDFIGIRVNRAKKSGMVNITSSVNSRERSGINTILHELNPLFTINVTMRD